MTWSWICAAACLVALPESVVAVDEAAVAVAATEQLDIDALVRQGEALIQIVLTQHVDPPTRQEMWLEGTKAVFENIPGTSPARLSHRISQITRPDEFRDLLKQVWFQELTPERRRTAPAAPRLTAAFLDGVVSRVPHAQLLSASEGVARTQSAANRYIGTGIMPSYNVAEGFAVIEKLIRGGPMERAGGREGDRITKIGERDAQNMPLGQVIELLRGEEGTTVILNLRESAGAEPRIVTVTRGPVVLDAVEGLTRNRDGKWDFRVEPHFPIGYVRFRQVNGSAVHELRRLEQQFRTDGIAAVILDFRATTSSDAQQAVLVADALLDGGLIGRLRSPNGRVQEFQADRDCLFRGWPLTVLIDGTTNGGGEWIAAALQDNRACIVMGEPSAGSEMTRSVVPVPGENLSVQLPTGFFERPLKKPGQKPVATAPVQPDGGLPEPLPTAVIPDRIVPEVVAPTGPGLSVNDGQRIARARREQLRAQRDPNGGKDIVITTAVYELRDRIK